MGRAQDCGPERPRGVRASGRPKEDKTGQGTQECNDVRHGKFLYGGGQDEDATRLEIRRGQTETAIGSTPGTEEMIRRRPWEQNRKGRAACWVGVGRSMASDHQTWFSVLQWDSSGLARLTTCFFLVWLRSPLAIAVFKLCVGGGLFVFGNVDFFNTKIVIPCLSDLGTPCLASTGGGSNRSFLHIVDCRPVSGFFPFSRLSFFLSSYLTA